MYSHIPTEGAVSPIVGLATYALADARYVSNAKNPCEDTCNALTGT